MKVVILCGGKGTRFREYPEEIPKPLAPIGNKPILWHIMKTYAHYGFKDFILCLGYKGDLIKKYFIEEEWRDSDFTMNLKNRQKQTLAACDEEEDWNITFADTGAETNTGGRIKKIEKYIPEGENFLATYGDGLAGININELLEFHKKKGKIATITCLKPYSQFGIVEIDNDSTVTSFKEKPKLDYWINGGFFVFKKEVFSHIGENDVLEKKTFETLAAKKEIAAYKFEGFWQCMDTFKDYQSFSELWEKGAPWKVWK